MQVFLDFVIGSSFKLKIYHVSKLSTFALDPNLASTPVKMEKWRFQILMEFEKHSFNKYPNENGGRGGRQKRILFLSLILLFIT